MKHVLLPIDEDAETVFIQGGHEYCWMNAPGYSDYAVAGRPLHAIGKDSRSLCGLYRRQWSFDNYNRIKCRNCLKHIRG